MEAKRFILVLRQNEFLSGAILRAHVQAEAHHPGFSLLVLVFGMWGLGVRATVVA